MSEQKIIQSGVAMVRISGSKVRSLREEQNLTQLYLSSAVGVTTETISRWERQEAPTLKEENGLKLADVLGVSMEEILFQQEQVAEEEGTALTPIQQGKTAQLFALAAVVLLAVVVLFAVFKDDEVLHFSAKRLMPAHSVAGHPFPVVIEVDFVSGENSSLLLKEQLPSGCSVLRTAPQATVAEKGLLKWIDKNGPGKRTFSYLIHCTAGKGADDGLSFAGSLLVRQPSRHEVDVGGRERLRLSIFHWADSDTNHIIDDEELLAVYDDYGQVEGLGLDVEEVEAIWMGSSYLWDLEKSAFEIIP